MKQAALEEILTKIGLSEKEAKIYITLLGLKEAAPSTISRKSGLKRPTTYIILQQLQKLGMVSHVTKKAQLYYSATDPRIFLKEHQSKLKSLENAIPELLSLHKSFGATPQLSIHEGKAGLIQIMEDTLTASTELLCWADITLATNTILEDYYPKYIKKKIKNQIPLRGIFCHDKTALAFKKRGEKELREIYTIPKDKFPFDNEINIYDDKIAIISHEDNIGVIIQNNHIANTQRSIFKFAFEYAKSLEKDMLTKEDLSYLNDDTIESGVLTHCPNCTCPSADSPCIA